MTAYMSDTQQEIIDLEFPYCVRIRPGMYLPNITHMVTEISDNSLDEHSAGYATGIAVFIQKDEEIISIIDDGRGIPTEPSKKNPLVSQVELAASTLHAGGKFNVTENENGEYIQQQNGIKATGLHGVGLSVVNALSEWMVIKVNRNGKLYQITFEKGIKTQDLTIIGEVDEETTGTEVTFKPDRSIWKDDDVIDLNIVKDRLDTLAHLNPGLTNCLYVYETEDSEPVETIFQYENGIQEFVDKKVEGKKKVTDTLEIQGTHNGVDVYVGMVYTDTYNIENILSFCNNAATTEHGDHVTGLKTAISKTVTDYMTDNDINFKFENNDTLEGLTAIVSVKVQDPFFDGQGKNKIKMTIVRQAVKKVVEEYLKDYLDHNPDIAKALLDKIRDASKARVAAQKAKETIRKIKETSDSPIGLAGKLADCSSKNPEECEINIVEGDSAGGTAKSARNRKFQAIIAPFGKPLNVEKKRIHEVIASEKLKDLVRALKCGIGEEFDISKIRYHKIIIMSDADVDGSHIKTLYLAFFYRYMKEVIERGYLYFSCPPLYKVIVGKNTYYVKDDAEKDEFLNKLGNKKAEVQRFKGLGEMNANELWETTMDPERRTLEQIVIEDIEKDEYMLSLCMGDNVPPRKEFIMQHSLEANIDC
jgi:DNA gyrase subunit B